MSNQGRLCDTCHAALSILYCHADMAYLCSACDSTVHSTNSMITWHKRVCLCTECMYAPAAFACRADAASLCINCDAEVHSANMLAARHERVPVGPMSCFLSSPSIIETEVVDDGENGASCWLLDEPERDEGASNNEALFIEVDGYLNLANYNQFNDTCYHYQYNPDLSIGIWGNSNTENKSIVPLKLEETSEQQQQQQQQQSLENLYMEMEKNMPKTGFFHSPSSNQSAIVPFLDADTAQDSTTSTIWNTYSRVPPGTFGLYPTLHLPVGLAVTPMSREARVLRYREKKKARKFEKTIRYASRKAYAETRPRLKGRFAKKTEIEYTDGIVPSL